MMGDDLTVDTNPKQFVQAYIENIAQVLGLDVTILDVNGVRISGTGHYRNRIGEPVPDGSFFKMILKTGKPGMIFDVRPDVPQCRHCQFVYQCKEAATIGYPLLRGNRPVGVIGIIGFSPDQKAKMISHSEQLIQFLHHVSLLLESSTGAIDFACESVCDQSGTLKRVSFDNLVGADSGLVDVIQRAKRVVNSPSTVFIQGESGTGKELLARAMHDESRRSMHPFVAINCAAIPENLLESELFGYEGGAFTGSKREGSAGKFELAHKGTIFLDEIGDLPLSMQPKLLRVLQEREIERVGGKRTIPVDVRVIAATHRNLADMVKDGSFREDLY